MKQTEHRNNVVRHSTDPLGANCSVCLLQDFSLLISELPPHLRAETKKFVRFTEMILGRLNSIGSGVCSRYLQELRVCPENYDQMAGYHIEILARKIGKEVDTLYKSLQVSTIEHIGIWYEKWSRENNGEEYQETESTC